MAAALAVCLLVALGPVPLALTVALHRERDAAGKSWSESALVFLLAWCLAQETVALVLLATGTLSRLGVAFAETVWLAIGLATLAVARRRCSWRALAYPKPSLSPTERLLAAAFATLGAYLCWTNVTTPVGEYDSLAYHLPQMAEWVRHHGLAAFAQTDATQVGFYPYGWEAVCSLPLAAAGRDALATMPNLVALAIMALAVFRLARQIGARRADAMFAALLLPCAPLLVDRVNSLQVDLPLAAFVLAGLALGWSWSASSSTVDLALAIACAGLAAGVKMSGLMYVPVLLGLGAALRVTRRGRGFPPPAPVRRDVRVVAAGIAVAAFFVGAFWYWSNLARCGNPLGNVQVRLGGFTVFAGDPGFSLLVSRTTLAHLFDPTSPRHWFVLGREVFVRLGVPFLLSLPLIAAGLASRRRHRWLVVAAIVATALVYWTTPYSGDNGDHGFQLTPWTGQAFRFAFPCVGVLGALAGAGATRLGVRDRTIAALAAVVAASVVGRLLFNRSVITSGIKPASPTGALHYAAALAIAAVAVGAVALTWRIGRPTWGRMLPSRGSGRQRTVVRCGFVLTSGALLVAAFAATSIRERQRPRAYGAAYAYIAEKMPPGETVGYILSHRAYLLYGPDLSRPVRWVPPRGGDLVRWVAALRSEGVCTVAAGPVLPEWQSSQALALLRASSGPFEPLCVGDLSQAMGVYRLRGCTAAPAGPTRRELPQ